MGLTKNNFYKKPEIEIMTSWDDGGKLDLRIAALLIKYNFHGVFYVVVDWIDKEGYLTWDDIKELDKSGFEIGSHTINHPQDLKALHDESLFLEVQSSKDMIEAVLNHPVKSFCYPRGRADERVKDQVKEAEYMNARGTGRTGVTTKEDPFYLPGTIHIFKREEYGDKSVLEYAKEVIDRACTESNPYINIWGHSAEVDENNLWEELEEILKYVNEKVDKI